MRMEYKRRNKQIQAFEGCSHQLSYKILFKMGLKFLFIYFKLVSWHAVLCSSTGVQTALIECFQGNLV